MTPKMKSWLAAEGHIGQDATDEQAKAKAAELLVSGVLSTEKWIELTVEPVDESPAQALLKAVVESNNRLAEQMAAGFAAMSAKTAAFAETAEVEAKPASAEAEKKPEPADEKKAPAVVVAAESAGGLNVGKAAAEAEETRVRVLGVKDKFDTTKQTLVAPNEVRTGFARRSHVSGGHALTEGQRPLSGVSELDKAVSGAYFKFMIESQLGGRVPAGWKMTDLDRSLVEFALHEMEWGGVINGKCTSEDQAIGIKGQRLDPRTRKAVLDDASSGGLEIAPIVFDDQIITTPLLYGEFAPLVNMVPITRGRRIEGASMGTVTLSSGGADGTDISLFSTSSFISAFDTTIFACDGAIEIGLDFMSDSPVNVAEMVTAQYGMVLLKWLDEQICVGDGTTEPEGIMNASGTTSVSHSNTAPTVGGYESLFFGVSKEYKQGYDNRRISFGGTETSYQRFRAIKVGTSDERRIFGTSNDYSSYMGMGHPYGINEAMANTQLFFAVMARYRMYRRLGLTVGVTTEGKTLRRANEMLITARARFGGQLEDGAAAAVVTDAQA